MAKEIKITCNGSRSVDIGDLQDFQGGLKKIERADLEKLKNSILKYGFSFPVFCWNDNILDGHHRVLATNALIEDGFKIDKIPIVDIDAKDETEAAEKLLQINSEYAKITKEGFYDFVNRTSIDIESIADEISISSVDVESLLSSLDGVFSNYEQASSSDDGATQKNSFEKIIIGLDKNDTDYELAKQSLMDIIKLHGLNVSYE